MHVLITGAGSFIGRFTTEVLLSAGLKVTATYYSESQVIQTLRGLNNAPELIQLDLSEKNGYSQLPEHIDAVVHIAALANIPGLSADDILNCNVSGTRNIQQYALSAGSSRMIYLSSISVHGIVSAPVIDEVLPIVDPDIYGTTKYLGERMLASTATNMPVVSIRLPGVLGRGATCRVWIPMLLKKMINNEDVELYNPDEKFNNAIHVSDLANFILKLLRRDTLSGFHAFPIAASGMTTIREVAEYLKKLVNSSSIIIVKSSERQAFTINSRYAVSHFGYEQRAIIETIDNFVKDALISQ